MNSYKALSNQESKTLSSLSQKKYRDELGLFRAEGSKVILPLMPFFELHLLVIKEGTKAEWSNISQDICRIATESQFNKLSLLESPGDAIAIFSKRKDQPKSFDLHRPSGITVALDCIQNPGNLGTIIRLCDWLGIRDLLLGEGCVDPSNPKVVQSTAGALGALRIYENVNLAEVLPSLGCPIIGTSLDGEDVHHFEKPQKDLVILFGNEGHGLSDTLKANCTRLIRIPSANTTVSDSLNVSISAAIILSQITFS